MTTSPELDDNAPPKALYLVSLHQQHIHNDDVRLIVSVEQSTPRPFPFSRIARIVSGPNTQWRGNAIAACLMRDIPIIWLDKANQPTGDAHPLYREGGPLHHDIHHYLDLPDSMERYANWRKSQRMNSITHLRDQGLLGWMDAARHTKDYVYKNTPRSQPSPIIRAACQSVVNRRLAELHTRTRYWGQEGQPLELASDLAHILTMEYHLAHPEQPQGQDRQIHQFETWWKQGRARLEHLLSNFRKHISNEVESWL